MKVDQLKDFAKIRSACQLLEGKGIWANLLTKEQERLTYQPGEKVLVDLIFGQSMWVDPTETVGRELFRWGMFELELTEFFQQYLPTDAVFIDIGAHIGYFSVQAMSLLGPEGRLIAFEPMPETYKRLTDNLNKSGNTSTNFDALEYCVNDYSGEATLFWYGHQRSAFSSFAAQRSDTESTSKGEAVNVRATKLDDIFGQFGIAVSQPVFIKIDAESAEFDILLGAVTLIQTYRPIITLEVGDFAELNSAVIATTTQLLGFVGSLGYNLFDWHRGELIPHRLKDAGGYGYWNVICVPRELGDLPTERASLGSYD